MLKNANRKCLKRRIVNVEKRESKMSLKEFRKCLKRNFGNVEKGVLGNVKKINRKC
jgi:hypothetical protein